MRDSAFALLYWFEAPTHSAILWGIDDTSAARAVLARLGPTRRGQALVQGADRDIEEVVIFVANRARQD